VTEGESDSKVGNETSFRRRVGKIVFVAGILLISIMITLGTLASLAAAYTGSVNMIHSFSDLVLFGLGIGLMLSIVGLVAMLLPEGPSKDWLWSMKTGPYIR
jgi:hypothetical protein